MSAGPGFRAGVATLFPEMFPGPLGVSLAGRALEEGLWALETVNIRDHAHDRHGSVDDSPAGGGPGMVMRADVAAAALDAAGAGADARPVCYLTPRGRPFTQALARDFAAGPGLVLLCGRFEGLDERVIEARNLREVSLGDFVLSGGEVAAFAVLDAVIRLLPGVMGAESSLEEESFSHGLLEYPHYTRPREWQGMAIPEVLLSGDHGAVAAWRRGQAEKITRARRPDLWARRAKRKD